MDPKNRIFASNLKRNTEMRPTRSGFFADLTRALADTQTLIREMHPQIFPASMNPSSFAGRSVWAVLSIR